MANKKKQKYPQSKIKADASQYVIKAGDYNGATDSSAFMVSGHSSGSPYSEMEELSEQLTRDVGGRPYQPVEFGSDQGETGYDDYQGEGLGDLGGPEMYGNKPSLLKKSPIHHAGTSRGLAIGASVALAATALLGGLAFYFRQSSQGKTAAKRRTSHAGAHKAATAATAAATAKRAAGTSTAKKRTTKAKRATSASAKRADGAAATTSTAKRKASARTSARLQ